MSSGQGIDTGGTCTDAVLYDSTRKDSGVGEGRHHRDNLAVGILRAIDTCPRPLLPDVARVALSTTLATICHVWKTRAAGPGCS